MKKLILVLLALLTLSVPVSATNQSGTNITNCNSFGGGVKLINIDNSGGDRVWCPTGRGENTVDNNFESSSGVNSLFDVGLFDNRTDVIRLRASANCSVVISLNRSLNESGSSNLYSVSNLTGDTAKTVEYDVQDNIFSSGHIRTNCQ